MTSTYDDYPHSPLLAELHASFERSQVDEECASPAISFMAADGRTLQGRLFRTAHAPKAALLIGGATGVPQRFYARYAEWLTSQGLIVLTFDYRGVGASRDRPLSQDDARMRDWGLLDLPAALDHLHRQAPDLPLYFMGHSVGGQMLGLMPNRHLVSKAVLIASGFGYWRNMSRRYGYMVKGLIAGLGPLLYRSLGYSPHSRIGWGEDLPRGVAEDWFRWCQRPDYYAELLQAQGRTHFNDLTLPLLALSFTDDPIATEGNVNAQLALYNGADISRSPIHPADHGLKGIGHLHFFSARMPMTLWQRPLDWLLSPTYGPMP